jgi:dTDP-4-dehydrorhamnose 3,5-epimerase
MSPQNDPTVIAALRDVATVTPAGKTLATQIDGVSTLSPVNHVDHRGRVFEVYAGESDHWKEPLTYCYAFTVRAGQTKGWGLHEKKTDRYTLITGEVMVVLYDARVGSPTHGLVQKVVLTGEGIRQLVIPTGVWHMNICLSEQEAYLINHPTAVYEHGAPDRLLLPWNTKEIPVDISQFFPNQHKAR